MTNFLKIYHENEEGRDFVLSDLHGCYTDFLNKLESVNFDKESDRVFSVGDLVDRSPDSINCLRLLDEEWFHPIIGNHEWLWAVAHMHFHSYYIANVKPTDSLKEYHIFMGNGGEIVDMDGSNNFVPYMIDKIFNLPRAIEIRNKDEKIGIVHGEHFSDDWNDFYTLKESEYHFVEDMLLWGRSMAAYEQNPDVDYRIKNIDRVFMGHTIVPQVTQVENRFYIETGGYLRYYLKQNAFRKKKKKGYLMELTLMEL